MESWGWVYLTFMAASAQALRTGGQKHLTQHLGTLAVTLVRFAFGLPFAVAYLAVLLTLLDKDIPTLTLTFVVYCLAGSLSQIVATLMLIYLFSLRNFAVGTTYARTEAFLTAVVGAVFFGEFINLLGWLAIAISVAGVVIITVVRTAYDQGGGVVARLINPSAAVGLTSGLAFALASLFIRRASLSLGDDGFMFPAAVTLVTVIVIQCTLLTGYLLFAQRGQFAIIAWQWKVGVFVGATSTLGSIGWFTAFTMQNAAYVRALGQIELVFTFIVSAFFFRERTSRVEVAGIFLIIAAIVTIILSR